MEYLLYHNTDGWQLLFVYNHNEWQSGGDIYDTTLNAVTTPVEVWEGISKFIFHFIMDVITYPCRD